MTQMPMTKSLAITSVMASINLNFQVTGAMRSNAATSLDIWHLAQDYGVAPTLNHIIQDNIPLSRCIAVPTEPEFILDAYFKVTSSRPMQTYSIPGGRL